MYREIKNLITVIFIILVFSLISCRKNYLCQTSKKNLKVLAWNIWHGGHSSSYPEIGCENIIGILKHSGADIVIVVETYGSASKIADSLGFYHRLISNNLSIYSRYPILQTLVFPDSISTFNFGGIKIDYNGTPIHIFSTWLNSLPDCRLVPENKTESDIINWDNAGSRDDEMRAILSVLKNMINAADSIPIILGGDFNIHSHLDWITSTRNLYKHNGAVVNWTVSKQMEKAGFIDSYREIKPNPVIDIGTTWMYEVEDGGGDLGVPDRSDRIDYIYYMGGKLKVVNSETYYSQLGDVISFKNKDFIYMSDHGFVFTEFEIVD